MAHRQRAGGWRKQGVAFSPLPTATEFSCEIGDTGIAAD